ncbi:MAG TPA: PilZ domain-containing protein [Kofleriaceae bacterium]
MEDRRSSPRYEAYVSAWIEASQGRSTIAITRDISAAGLLILTRLPLEIGEAVKLTAALGDSQHTLSGKVVRQESLPPHELWHYKAAVAVDEADPALARFHAALAEQSRP